MLALTTALLVAGTTPTEGWTARCWKASVHDRDGDGYADYHAHKNDRQTIEVPYAERGTCPTGWVKQRGDCNDADPRVHPRRPEVPGNGRDDDCDAAVDEPMLRYAPDGFATRVDGFALMVAIVPRRNLSFRAVVEPVGRPEERRIVPLRRLRHLARVGESVVGRVRLDALEPATVYRARIQVFGGARPLGEPSDWYVTMTDSADPELARRGRAVRRALYEQALSTHEGRVGYRGEPWPDGSRYGAAVGEPWCSELYGWVAAHEYDFGTEASVSQLRAWFDARGLYREVATAADLTGALPGDYLAVDTSDDGDPNHSAMLLFWDGTTAWTVEGNTTGDSGLGDSYASRRGSNEIFFETRGVDRIKGMGRLP